MAFVRLGSQFFIPEHNSPSSSNPQGPTDVLNTARLMESQLRDLERMCDDSRARRAANKKRVDSLDKLLTELRVQERREKETSRKLSKTWAKSWGIDVARPGVLSVVQAYGPTRYMNEDPPLPPVQTTRFTDRAEPLFNNPRDWNLLFGPAQQAVRDWTRPVRSDELEDTSNPDHIDVSSFGDCQKGHFDSFTFSASAWKTSGQDERIVFPPGTEYNGTNRGQYDMQSLSTTSDSSTIYQLASESVKTPQMVPGMWVDSQVLTDLRIGDVDGNGSGRKRGLPRSDLLDRDLGVKRSWGKKRKLAGGDYSETVSLIGAGDREVMGENVMACGLWGKHDRSNSKKPWQKGYH